MKVNIEIECTPVEARQFFGLPNVEPMQSAVMQQLEKRILADIERFSPEALMTSWLPLVPQGAEQNSVFLSWHFPYDPRAIERMMGTLICLRLATDPQARWSERTNRAHTATEQ